MKGRPRHEANDFARTFGFTAFCIHNIIMIIIIHNINAPPTAARNCTKRLIFFGRCSDNILTRLRHKKKLAQPFYKYVTPAGCVSGPHLPWSNNLLGVRVHSRWKVLLITLSPLYRTASARTSQIVLSSSIPYNNVYKTCPRQPRVYL